MDQPFRNRGAAAALLAAAEEWALCEAGAHHVEMLCLDTAAKAACWNAGFALWNPWTGRWPIVPAVFFKATSE